MLEEVLLISMKEKAYEKLVKEEFGKIWSDPQVSTLSGKELDYFWISFDSEYKKIDPKTEGDCPVKDPYCCGFDFCLNKKEKRMEHLWLTLRPEVRGKGYGRKVIQFMEKMAELLKAEKIRINICTNVPFWSHIGFEKGEDMHDGAGNCWEKIPDWKR